MQAIMNTRVKLTNNQKGMTLIELLAVVVILGILAAVAGTAVVGSINKSKTSADAATIQIVTDAAQRYVLDNSPTDGATVTIAALVSNGYLTHAPTSSVDSTKPYFKLTVTKSGSAYTYSVATDATGN